jgi:protein-S-isoprenylcysteine O-methyltransferase Ste14
MYAGLALTYAGAALLVHSWWPLLGLPIVLAVVFQLAIRPEERYLSTRYGQEYATYQGRVRRWL